MGGSNGPGPALFSAGGYDSTISASRSEQDKAYSQFQNGMAIIQNKSPIKLLSLQPSRVKAVRRTASINGSLLLLLLLPFTRPVPIHIQLQFTQINGFIVQCM